MLEELNRVPHFLGRQHGVDQDQNPEQLASASQLLLTIGNSGMSYAARVKPQKSPNHV